MADTPAVRNARDRARKRRKARVVPVEVLDSTYDRLIDGLVERRLLKEDDVDNRRLVGEALGRFLDATNIFRDASRQSHAEPVQSANTKSKCEAA